jgi:hypothetical protein
MSSFYLQVRNAADCLLKNSVIVVRNVTNKVKYFIIMKSSSERLLLKYYSFFTSSHPIGS